MSEESTAPEQLEPPIAHLKIIYQGPAAPHWEFRSDFGSDQKIFGDIRSRAEARLLLLPPHDPQFQRNRERINRDAERQNILVDWDLGYEETPEE